MDILLIEDNPGDARLASEAFKEVTYFSRIHLIPDGVQAMAYLRGQPPYQEAIHPDIILLDLNLPRKDGRSVLAEIKADPALRHLPVIVLTTSQAEADIARAYDLHANCYIVKPTDFDQFAEVVRGIEAFWHTLVRLPSRMKASARRVVSET